jgi:hypothetical protein
MRRCAICPTMSGMIERQSCARSPRECPTSTPRTMLRLAEDYDKFNDRAGGRPPSRGIAVYSTHKTAKRQIAFGNRAAS